MDETLWMEWIPLCEEGLHPVKVLWPTAMEFTNGRDDWYTLLTEGQGLLIPNTWKTELGKLSFDGRFETSGGYMPWSVFQTTPSFSILSPSVSSSSITASDPLSIFFIV